ncbi:uncharacterized protein AMSG_00565 [Thecamonas trahens ATCC 50062]|uniref:Ubiquinol-cytochrome c chaperone domain-containing protein n=1 Tax=Thecamonas trahens ATCC 50062 TaxID=461836 RepID=A0A0L0D9N3_THETB|nr:hypothetical protein AMSG_00565 [Thecamonas trahens ATCC 50062]KNC48786.1 hypothetical protein AMSG_00565 [Thecamonas trahens ATCC 50062]|eukprot:XP_013762837.1 hypothetical protein AMSG_00565 [Thecamonas trahens ATCC 50062]
MADRLPTLAGRAVASRLVAGMSKVSAGSAFSAAVHSSQGKGKGKGKGKCGEGGHDGDGPVVMTVGEVKDEASLPFKYRMARRVGRMLGWFSTESTAIRASKPLMAAFSAMGDDVQIRARVGLPADDSFRAWYGLVVLQTWMYMVRMRTEGSYGAQMRQALFDSLWEEVEVRIRATGITQDSLLARNVKDLLGMFYGAAVGYDEGFIGDDTVLAAALWRNLYSMSPNVEANELARMVDYVRAQIAHLQTLPPEEVLSGDFEFPTPPTFRL